MVYYSNYYLQVEFALTRRYIDRLPDDQKALFKKPLLGFYVVLGSGDGGVTLFVKKSPLLWFLRLVFFFELNVFMLDQDGCPIVFNKIKLLSRFLKGKIRYNSNVSWVSFQEMGRDEYEGYWADRGYTPEQLKADKSIDLWPSPYHRQFFIEAPLSRRSIIPFWTPSIK